ncbi:MAG: ABC-type branched-chain amino acid transport system periplasmic component, partial [Thermoleophilia bacterium]|nr:ABC-type branched-chain amino acid transport system periplasmic component [Thermoleophilia bacterium]
MQIRGNRFVQRAVTVTAALMLAALVAAGCGGAGGASGGSGGGKPLTEVVIASDFPLTGSSRAQTESMVQAIEMLLKEHNGKAGSVKVTYKSMDDATAQAGKWDEAKCAENVQTVAKDPKVVVLVGPMNSGCAQIQIKTANTAGLAM